MAPQQIVPGVYAVPLGIVNVFLVEPAGGGRGLTLVDTATPGSAPKILDAVRALGREPADLQDIIVTHLHVDHAGSLAELKAATGARAWMHAADAAMVRAGRAARPLRPAPGPLPWLMTRLMGISGDPGVPAAEVEHEVADGDLLPLAGGMRAVHAPGHAAGQIALHLPRAGGLLLAADACANMLGRLGLSIVYEDLAEGRRSLAKLAALEFEHACFGHGPALAGGAAARFRALWG